MASHQNRKQSLLIAEIDEMAIALAYFFYVIDSSLKRELEKLRREVATSLDLGGASPKEKLSL
jgi:hypothetical protein